MAESPIVSSMVVEPPDQGDKKTSWDLFPWKDFPGYTQSQRCASTSSWIWQFGYDIEKSDDDTKRRWVCKVCVDSRRPNPHSAASSGTQNAEIHLWNDHKVCDPSGRRKPPSKAKEKTPSRNIAEMMKLNTRDAREQQIANQIIGRFDRLDFQRLVVSWIINSNSSFRQSEDPYLRAAFEYLNPLVKTTEAHITHNTVRRRILQVYEENKAEIKRVLATAPGLLHIAFDGWRSNNRHALYGICCYFLNTLGQPGKLVLGLPELVDRHSGDNIATHVVEVLRSYGITHKVGYFTLDNASNNDTAMEEIGKALGFEGKTRRLRCFGHILNLAVKALLFGHNSEAFEDDIQGNETLDAKAHELWRRKGPVGKLHNLIFWIHRSDSLTNLLRSLQLTVYSKSDDPVVRAKKPLDIIIDVVTRWLSTLYMIRRALLLKDFLEDLWYEQKSEWEGLVLRGKKSSSEMPLCLRDENKLEERDWAIISLFNEVLQHFEHVLITLEGDGQKRKRKEGYIGAYGCLWDTLLGYEYLLGKMEVYKAAAHRYPDPEHFKVNINLCWKKLDKYYSRLDETPVYYAAIALHPAYRWGYFEDVWADRPDWIQTAKSLVEELYRSHYEPRIISRDRERGEPVTKKRRIYRNPFDEYREESRQAPTLLQPASSMTTLLQAEDAASSSTHAVGDEYSDWFRDVHKSDQNILDPISYWYERREEYPRLSQMALDVLSVLPMSIDVERLFSTCGRMVRDDRARLDASTIGMTQTVRSWHCGGYIKSTEKLFEDAKVPGTDLLAEMSFAEAREATGGRITCTVPL
ncbi:putative AC transposase [Fusarium oxysporum f. sp. cubense]|nr:putative AC transposase [Fusarium oxysporum f. sp. cubense]